MLLMPKRVKYRKSQKGKSRGIATTGAQMHFGEFGLKALENGFVPARQLEASRVVVARKLRGTGKLWISAFPHKSITKKPAETRMGKGKGAPEEWVAVVRPGKILFEMEGVTPEIAEAAFRLAAHKIPMRTKFIHRDAAE